MIQVLIEKSVDDLIIDNEIREKCESHRIRYLV